MANPTSGPVFARERLSQQRNPLCVVLVMSVQPCLPAAWVLPGRSAQLCSFCGLALSMCRVRVFVGRRSPPRRPRAGGTRYQRLSGSLLEGTDREDEQPWTFNPVRFSLWVFSWAVPGMGMFLEGYFIFRCALRHRRELVSQERSQGGGNRWSTRSLCVVTYVIAQTIPTPVRSCFRNLFQLVHLTICLLLIQRQ